MIPLDVVWPGSLHTQAMQCPVDTITRMYSGNEFA
jgi:hypothetical protein